MLQLQWLAVAVAVAVARYCWSLMMSNTRLKWEVQGCQRREVSSCVARGRLPKDARRSFHSLAFLNFQLWQVDRFFYKVRGGVRWAPRLGACACFCFPRSFELSTAVQFLGSFPATLQYLQPNLCSNIGKSNRDSMEQYHPMITYEPFVWSAKLVSLAVPSLKCKKSANILEYEDMAHKISVY